MRVLSIGTDRSILEEGSPARLRQQSYADALGNLDIILFSKGGRRAAFSQDGLTVIPTCSWSQFVYGWSAWRIATRLPLPDVVTVQDPFETGLIGLCIAKWLHVPLHVQVHTDFTARAFRRHSLLNRVRTWIAWFVLRRAARVRVILQRTKDELQSAGITAPICVLPIFVDTVRLGGLARARHQRWKIDASYHRSQLER
jgi:hypothetical protein